MKIFWLMAVLSASLNWAAAQEIPQTEVPSVVLSSFHSNFNSIEKVEWERKDKMYKAEFEISSREHDVLIDSMGNIKRHKQDFPKKELPQTIKQYVADHLGEYKIDDVDKITEGANNFYQVDLEKSGEDRELLFSDSGKLIRDKRN